MKAAKGGRYRRTSSLYKVEEEKTSYSVPDSFALVPLSSGIKQQKGKKKDQGRKHTGALHHPPYKPPNLGTK